mgnify:CR=1 FL=1
MRTDSRLPANSAPLSARLTGLAAGLLLGTLAALPATAITVTTAVGQGADAQVNEFNNTPQDNSANNQQLNARWASTVNEVIALRFDLTGYTPAALTNVQLELINHRANTARVLHYYGVPDGTPGADNNGTIHGYTDDTWQEGTLRFSTMPGLQYDGDPNTKGFSNVVDLGSATMNATAKGSSVTYSSAALTAFVQNHPDALLTILVGVDTASTGQSRFGSKETTALDGGTPTGAAGSFAPRLNFTIACAPAGITSPPASQQTLLGANATFTLTATGSGPAYQWQVSTNAGGTWNNVTVGTGGASASYSTAPVTLADSGNQYRCVVSVACDGSAVTSAVATLTVVAPPTITGLSNQAVYAGTDVTLTATVSGVPSPALQWFKDGGELPGETSAVLALPNAQPAASGTYSLVASNLAGSVTNSVTLTVSVGDLAPSITGPANQTAVAGGAVTFTATVLGLPVPDLQWLENGVPLVGGTSATLTLAGITAAQDGYVYSLVASNSAGQATNSATLTVLTPPVITVQPTNDTVTNSQPAQFAVTATGSPAPGYQWFRNESPLSGATSATYTIGSATPAAMGTYFVVVTNSVGAVTSTVVTLTVNSTMTPVALVPANNATGRCYDTPLYLTFSTTPFLRKAGTIRIFNATNPATPVGTINLALNTDKTAFSSQVNNATNFQPRALFPGDSQAYNHFPVILTGTTAAIYPPPGVMTSNQTYFVTVDNGTFADSAGALFAGLTDTNAWRFTTKPGGPANPTNLVVAADGTGDFVTVQGAIDFVPLNNATPRLIHIRNGNYVEIVNISGKHKLTLRGESRAGTVIGYANNANLAPGGTTHARASFKVNADDIALDNLTLTNHTPVGGSQAEALMLSTGAERFIFHNCAVGSYQDTILANQNSSQGYFVNSLVMGQFDYIWGGGNLFFTNCEIRTLTGYNGSTTGGNVTAARTDANASANWPGYNGLSASNGFAFVGCQFTRSSEAISGTTVAGSNGATNGNVAWIHCTFSANYTTPSSAVLNSQLLWEFGNSNLTLTAPYPLGLAVGASAPALTAGDPRLLAARSATTWLNGWVPQLSPHFTHQPVGQTRLVGESVTFAAAATGLPAPAYQWLKDGVPVAGATAATLILTNLSISDGAVYSVIASNAAGSTTSAGAALVISNRPPAAGYFFLPATQNTATSVASVKLEVVATDLDGDAVAVTAVHATSTNGGTAAWSGGLIHYTPAAGYTGADELAYTLTDARGAVAGGVITILVSPAGTGFNQLAPPEALGGGAWRLSYVGIPGFAYALEWRTNLTVGEWAPVRTNVAGPNGLLIFTNTSTAPQNYYRTRHAP